MLKAAEMAKGGEIFILKMPALRIGDLAETIIEELAPEYGHEPAEIKIKNIGKRLGEKLYEELMTEEEATDAYEDEGMFVVLSQTFDVTGKLLDKLPDNFKKTQKSKYSSKSVKLLTKKEVRSLLNDLNLE